MFCVKCNKKLELYNYCVQCKSYYCTQCKVNIWFCNGTNHILKPSACENCYQESGVIHKDKYYCFYCEPTDNLMKQLKSAAYLYAENQIPPAYVNNRKNADLFNMDPLSTLVTWKKQYPDPTTFSLTNHWKVKGYIPLAKYPRQKFGSFFNK